MLPVLHTWGFVCSYINHQDDMAEVLTVVVVVGGGALIRGTLPKLFTKLFQSSGDVNATGRGSGFIPK